jgi:hypothetical protein
MNTPTASSCHPTGLRCWRAATSAPTTKNASGAATSGADRRSAGPLSTLSTKSPPVPATHPAHSDQASRAAVRAVTRPLGCRGQLPDTPGSLIAQAGPSDGTFAYSEAVVRLGLLDVILTGDLPGIVTDFVRAHRSCPGLRPSLPSVKSAQRRTTRVGRRCIDLRGHKRLPS